MRARRLTRGFYAVESPRLASALLNKLLVRADGRAGRIVEVEAYGGLCDPASHAFRGPTQRNRAMFGPPGHLYVYFSYGVHWCANVVSGTPESGEAVLLRALEPVAGLDLMRAARWSTQRNQADRDLCRGPGRLCQAMGIDRSFDGLDLAAGGAPLWLAYDGREPPDEPLRSARVGISVAKEVCWRFSVPGHPGVSSPRPAAGRPGGRRPAVPASGEEPGPLP